MKVLSIMIFSPQYLIYLNIWHSQNFEGVNVKIQNLYMYNFFFHLNWTKKTQKLQDIIHIYISKNAYLIFMLFSFCSVHDNLLFAVFGKINF